ncbi:hypothetical protein PN502_00700, partial [Microcystis aeruginosa CS-338/01]|uniref:hypothetical protein n=1 Tax=Microcystis aeruginosa TaxID=1126 RepID=UPI00232EC496
HAMRPDGFGGGFGGFGFFGGGFWVIWAHAMRPDGFLGYLGFLGAVFGLFGRTQFDQLTDHGAPLPLAQ